MKPSTNTSDNLLEQTVESKALRLSAWGYFFMAVLGSVFFLFTQSEAILLDGVYSFISLLMTILAQRVSQLVQVPYSKDYHFGYAHFEPMLNVIRILLTLTITGFAAVSAFAALLDGGRALNANLAVIYGVLSSIGCLAMAWKQKQNSRKIQSPILETDAHNWLIDGILSSGVAVTFILAYYLHTTSYAQWVVYIDPMLVLIMVILIAPIPLKTLFENFREVLMQAPPANMQTEIHALVTEAIRPAKDTQFAVRMLPVGRFLYLQIHILVSTSEQTKENWDINRCDSIREQIQEKLTHIHPQITLDIIFTANQKWFQIDTPTDSKL